MLVRNACIHVDASTKLNDVRWKGAKALALLALTLNVNSPLNRTNPSTVYTHQPYNPIGLDLEMLNDPVKDPPEGPRSEAPGASRFRVYPKPNSAALGPAL